MLLIKPEVIQFEKPNDVIDYVTRGFPPSRAKFEGVMTALKTTYDDVCVDGASTNGKSIVIKKNIIPEEIDIDVYEDILRRTYNNRITNTATAAVLVAITFGVGFLIGKSSAKDDKDMYMEN